MRGLLPGANRHGPTSCVCPRRIVTWPDGPGSYAVGMPRIRSLRWSGRSQDLLVLAAADPEFLSEMGRRGMPASQIQLWIRERDVPITYRSEVRGLVEDWAYTHSVTAEAAGRGRHTT